MARRRTLKLATFNVNGIGTRLPHLLAWLDKEAPDIVALQELKALDEAFPVGELEAAGYGALWYGQRSWNGVALLGRDTVPVESRRGLPGDPKDIQSRYLEAAIHGIVVGAIYLPNGNPFPGPKYDYKLGWMRRLQRHAKGLVDLPHPVALLGDFNVIPHDSDVYDPKAWRRDALFQPEVRERYEELLSQGWTDASSATAGCASTTCCSIRCWRRAWRRPASTAGSGCRRRPATTRRPGRWSRHAGERRAPRRRREAAIQHAPHRRTRPWKSAAFGVAWPCAVLSKMTQAWSRGGRLARTRAASAASAAAS